MNRFGCRFGQLYLEPVLNHTTATLIRAPDALIRLIIEDFVAKGYNNPEIVTRLRRYYDTDAYNVSRRSQWGLKSARGQAHTITSIGPAIERQGSHDMRQTLIHEEKIIVSRKLILRYMNLYHPEDIQARKSRRLKRSIYWTAGVNDIWVFDQHDKWRRFQLYLHVAIEPFSGCVLWLKIWWTNRNPRLICGWYCDTVETLGAMPLVTQSDPGSENNGIANGHTLLRHMQDPTLARTLQHKFKGQHRNIKPKIFWSQLRRRWTPGFEDILDYGINNGIYNPDDALERLVFHYVFIPWLQHELDLFAEKFNNVKPRHNIHKILPHGRPNDIFYHTEDFESCDFSVKVDCTMLDAVRQTYTVPDHPVFCLVPHDFSQQASAFMAELGTRPVTRDNVWNIYADLLMCFRLIEEEEQIRKLLAAQPPLPCDGDKMLGSEDLPIVDLPPFVEGSGPGGENNSDAEEEQSDDVSSDFYEFDWTDDEP
ncbi:uncharacterized protein EDB91DRAFT_1331176 [Suillus paluster]|uniref:uncharacterized protein n=1 Tax=Suillus paluster TaxID=48578 RepID=UPI001B871CD7|nr:uncharacterized protein EDB91DRAFT_1331176 [Suillus paluster]KAG1724901.1 hypothetical protein EDB91DRAFT_1331176 [Suillus paluster]